MNFQLSPSDLLAPGKAQRSDVLLVLLRDGYEVLPERMTGLPATIAKAMQCGHWSPEAGKRLSLYLPDDAFASRVVLLGIGQGKPQDIRDALSKAVKELVNEDVRLAVYFAQDASLDHIRTAMLAVGGAGYVYSNTKPSAKGGLKKVIIGAPNAGACREGFEEGKALLAGMGLAREWANRPANHATPTMLGKVAEEIARNGNEGHADARFKCEVLDEAKVRKLGMGAFLAVAKGSTEPLRFIVLHYNGADRKQAPLTFVGKGITFDSGGISIKPGAGMDEMKFDMSGAASVLGLFEALRHLRPAINVVGLIPACENMPSGDATKPGDVITSMSGQTIEVLNTDAEGRLILCDALTYAERFKPQAVVDIATLTGNCVMALGNLRSGLFTQHDELAQAIEQAANESADLCWRMPMDDAYGKGLKSNFADMANIAGRTAGAISAAKFLERYTSAYPWAHLDIAGTAWDEGAAKGGTGRPVPLLVRLVLNLAKTPVQFALPAAEAKPATAAAKGAGKAQAKPALKAATAAAKGVSSVKPGAASKSAAAKATPAQEHAPKRGAGKGAAAGKR